MDDIEQDLRDQALGDEDATRRLAERLRAFNQAQGPDRAQIYEAGRQTGVQQAQAYVADRWDYLAALDYFRREHPAVMDNKVALNYAMAEDEKLSRTRPDLNYRERFALAAANTHAEFGDLESMDAPEAIAQIAGNRLVSTHVDTKNKARVAARAKAEKDEELYESEPDEDQQRWSEDIAQMARGRGLRPGPELSEDQRENIRRSRRA